MNIEDDIIAGQSLGGFKLGEKLTTYSELLEKNNEIGSLEYKQTNIYSTRYWVKDLPVEVNVDTRSGVIYKVSALEGYKGLIHNSIGIGSPTTELMNSKLQFYYDECDETFYSKKLNGIAIEVDKDDPLPEELPNLNVEIITIFLPELFNLS